MISNVLSACGNVSVQDTSANSCHIFCCRPHPQTLAAQSECFEVSVTVLLISCVPVTGRVNVDPIVGRPHLRCVSCCCGCWTVGANEDLDELIKNLKVRHCKNTKVG